jgi:lipopolysaccharide export system protein LptA
MSRALATILGVALWLIAAPAFAQGMGLLDRKSDAPIEIEADDGIEWRQADKVYVARGNVKVVRGEITLYADSVTAHYREAKNPGKPKDPKAQESAFGGGGTEIWKLEAVGNMRIETQADRVTGHRGVYNVDLGVLTLSGDVRMSSPEKNTTAYGDEAVYDTNQAVMVLTGRNLRIESPQSKITARDSLEYYEQKNLAVARGEAVAVQEDKRVRADVLTAHLLNRSAPAAGPAKAPPAKAPAGKQPAAAQQPGRSAPGGNTVAATGGGVERMDAFGNVVMSSNQSIARSDKGVYTVATGLAVLSGSVKITRGENQLNGDTAEVNLNTGISRILSGGATASNPGGRVRGLFAPSQVQPPAGAGEQLNDTRRAAVTDDPSRPRLPPKPVQ